MHSHHFSNHDANIRHWECERKGEKRAKDQEGFSFVVGVTWTFDPTLGIIWKQTKAQITSLNFRLKIKTSKVPIALFFQICRNKNQLSVLTATTTQISRENWQVSHLSTANLTNMLLPMEEVNRWPQLIACFQVLKLGKKGKVSLVNKTQSFQTVNAPAHYQTA